MSALQPGKSEPQATRESRMGHEPSHIQISWFVAVLAFLGFSAVIIHAGIWGWLKSMQGKAGIDAARTFAYRTPELGQRVPHLQVQPQLDWTSYRANQNALLNSYSWVDRSNGIVRIPITEAVDRILAHGLPRWSSNGSVSPLELQQARSAEGAR